MPGNAFGRNLRITSFGESHGPLVGVVVDGIPAGLYLDLDLVQEAMNRRRPGQSSVTTQRSERDKVVCWSGWLQGLCTGAPLCLTVANEDARPQDYAGMRDVLRPSHADFTTMARFGIRPPSGGGRSSARETAARVLAGAVASALLAHWGIRCQAWVHSVGSISIPDTEPSLATALTCPYSLSQIEASAVRCPHTATSEAMLRHIGEVREAGDSVGGLVRAWGEGIPAGLGDPVFDRLEADMAKAMLSINAAKAFEWGSGWAMCQGRGSQYNDAIVAADTERWKSVTTVTNHSAGVQGGISTAAPLWFSVGFKPPSTIAQPQQTVNMQGEAVVLEAVGRHDPCVVPRAVPVVEAMMALVLADHLLGLPAAQLSRLRQALA